jgi:hypothetical protein
MSDEAPDNNPLGRAGLSYCFQMSFLIQALRGGPAALYYPTVEMLFPAPLAEEGLRLRIDAEPIASILKLKE